MEKKTPNKHAERTRETRERLLKAAETVFVRDGFDGAELGEIATLAKRTKGAIYAQFKSKEDLFIALFQERTGIWADRFTNLIGDSRDGQRNIEVFREFFVNLYEDHAWLLLVLEFKLYASRNPKSRRRLRTIYKATYPGDEQIHSELFGKPKPRKDAISRTSTILTLLPILSAFAVEEQFAPLLLEDGVMKKMLARLFDALME